MVFAPYQPLARSCCRDPTPHEYYISTTHLEMQRDIINANAGNGCPEPCLEPASSDTRDFGAFASTVADAGDGAR